MARRSRVISRDRGFARAVAAIQAAGSAFVTVGVHGEVGEDALLIASVHEFGSDDGHIPERSFIRATVDERIADIATVQEKAARKIAAETLTVDQCLAVIGQWVKGAIQKRMADGIPPPNAPSTIAQKGSSKPLIDTGQLRQSITYAVGHGPRPESI